FFAALAHTSVAIVVLCRCAAPVLVALVAPSLLEERRHRRTLLALVVAAVGLVLVLQPWASAASASSASSGIGALCGLGSACWYACSVVVGKQLAPRHEATALAAWPLLVSVPVVVLAALVTGEGPLLSRVVVEGTPLLVLSVGGVVCGAVALLTFYAGLRRLPASRAGVLTLVEPVVAVVVGAVVFQEALAPMTVLGGAIVVAAVASVERRD
ncbi:MAG TPA: DMT family transporter, partial [Myxococcota bacterium]